MDVFNSLSRRTKAIIVSSALLLLTVAMGVLIFGDNVINNENALIDQAKGATKADMLYVHPEDTH